MPSGEGAVEAAQAAGGVGGAAAQADQFAGAVAVRQARATAARQALGRARAGAEAAMHAAAAVGHGRLAAGAARARPGAAARGLQVIAGRIAVLEATATLPGGGAVLGHRRRGRRTDRRSGASRSQSEVRGGCSVDGAAHPRNDPLDALHQPRRQPGHAQGLKVRPLVPAGRRGTVEELAGARPALHREGMAGG
jgi:hypothetical protein